MALTTCRECRKPVSTEAATCPSCGTPEPARRQSVPGAPSGLTFPAKVFLALVALIGALTAIGQCTDKARDAETAANEALRRTHDSTEVAAAITRGAQLRGREAIATDALVHAHGLQLPHDALHAAALVAHLDSAQRLITSGVGTTAIVAELAQAEAAGLPDSITRRHAALYARVKPRLDAEKEQQRRAERTAAVAARRAYAKTYEESLLDKGINATVTTSGTDATTLQMKWILVGKVLAHQYTKGSILGEMRNMGFRRFVITDGYDEAWSWDLSK